MVEFLHVVVDAMALNIKNKDVELLAVQIAELTGETLTAAVATALRERLERLQPPSAEELLRIGRDCAARLPKEVRDLDHATLLYDERGLPR